MINQRFMHKSNKTVTEVSVFERDTGPLRFSKGIEKIQEFHKHTNT